MPAASLDPRAAWIELPALRSRSPPEAMEADGREGIGPVNLVGGRASPRDGGADALGGVAAGHFAQDVSRPDNVSRRCRASVGHGWSPLRGPDPVGRSKPPAPPGSGAERTTPTRCEATSSAIRGGEGGSGGSPDSSWPEATSGENRHWKASEIKESVDLAGAEGHHYDPSATTFRARWWVRHLELATCRKGEHRGPP